MKNEFSGLKGKADLHIHTVYSDGKYKVFDILHILKEKEIKLFSITDHDTVDSIYELKSLPVTSDLNYIPGVEFSTEYDGREIHIIGYCIDYENNKFKLHIENFRKNRIERILKIIEKLNFLGLKFHPEDFFDYFGNTRAIGRPHLAEYILKLGYVKTYQEAFYKYIGDFRVAFYKKNSPDTFEVIKLIKEIGGISVLAHPGKSFLWDNINLLLKAGLDGLEIFHPTHKSALTLKLEKFAGENNLFVTGGSDFHGLSDDEINNIGRIFIDIEKLKFIKNYNI